MKKPASLLLLLTLPVSVAGRADGVQHVLSVEAGIPAVSITPQPPQRFLVELPTLEYEFHIEARCHNDWEPESLSVNVADSRVSKSAAALEEGPDQQVLLKIPAKQIAPLAMRSFCVIDDAVEGSIEAQGEPSAQPDPSPRPPSRLTVSAAMSAHASLRCRRGDEQKTVYVTRPLDVTLTCESGPAGAPAGD